MNINLPVDVFSKLLMLIDNEHGNMSINDAMDKGILQNYIDRYKAGEIELPDDQEWLEE